MINSQSGSTHEQFDPSSGIQPGDPLQNTSEEKTALYSSNIFTGIEERVNMYPELDKKNEEFANGLIEKFPNAFRKIDLPDGSIAAVLAIEDIADAVHARFAAIPDDANSQWTAVSEAGIGGEEYYMENPVSYIFSKDGLTYFHKKENVREETPNIFFKQAIATTRDPNQGWLIHHNYFHRTTKEETQLSNPETGQSIPAKIMNVPTGLLVEDNLFPSMRLPYWRELIKTVELYNGMKNLREPEEVLSKL
jgi:hypothetical protein